MKELTNPTLRTVIIVVFLISNFVLSIFIVNRSFVAQHQRLQTIEYIKCVVLLSKDNPTLTKDSPKKDVEAALDRCAKS